MPWVDGPMLFAVSVVEDGSVFNTVASASIASPTQITIVGDVVPGTL